MLMKISGQPKGRSLLVMRFAVLKVLYRQFLLKECNVGYYGSGSTTKSAMILLGSIDTMEDNCNLAKNFRPLIFNSTNIGKCFSLHGGIQQASGWILF